MKDGEEGPRHFHLGGGGRGGGGAVVLPAGFQHVRQAGVDGHRGPGRRRQLPRLVSVEGELVRLRGAPRVLGPLAVDRGARPGAVGPGPLRGPGGRRGRGHGRGGGRGRGALAGLRAVQGRVDVVDLGGRAENGRFPPPSRRGGGLRIV